MKLPKYGKLLVLAGLATVACTAWIAVPKLPQGGYVPIVSLPLPTPPGGVINLIQKVRAVPLTVTTKAGLAHPIKELESVKLQWQVNVIKDYRIENGKVIVEKSDPAIYDTDYKWTSNAPPKEGWKEFPGFPGPQPPYHSRVRVLKFLKSGFYELKLCRIETSGSVPADACDSVAYFVPED